MIRSIRAELLRLGRWPATWVLAGLWVVLALTFTYVFNYLAYRSENNTGFGAVTDDAGAAALLAEMMPDQSPVAVVQGMPMFGGAIVLILAALAVGSGYGWGTWKTAFTVGPRRGAVFAGTLGALGLIVTAMVITTFVLQLGVAVAIATVENQPLTWPGPLAVAQGIGGALLIATMWSAVGVLLGTLTRGPALSIGLGLIWALVVENLLRGVASLLGPVEALVDFMPGTAAGSLAASLGAATQDQPAGTPGVVSVLDGGQAAIMLGGYAVLLLAAAMLLTSRRDVA